MVPAAPTAVQVVVLAQEIAYKMLVVPEICEDQVLPPLVVAMIAPVISVAKQVLELGHDTLYRMLVVPDDCDVQVLPPLSVARMFPASHTPPQSLSPAPLLAITSFLLPSG